MTLNNCLVLLLSSHAERQLFVDNPALFQAKHDLMQADLHTLKQMDMIEVERQARELVVKRQREVTKLMPKTLRSQQEKFRAFAETQWPQGHKRHVLDAEAFIRYLDNMQGYVDVMERFNIRVRLHSSPFLLQAGWLTTLRGRRPALLVHLRLLGHRFRYHLMLG